LAKTPKITLFGYFGPKWPQNDRFWVILGHFGSFWGIWPYLTLFGSYFDLFWVIFGSFLTSFWVTFGTLFDRVWAVMADICYEWVNIKAIPDWLVEGPNHLKSPKIVVKKRSKRGQKEVIFGSFLGHFWVIFGSFLTLFWSYFDPFLVTFGTTFGTLFHPLLQGMLNRGLNPEE
jgi:hypothetical protein